MLEVAANLLKIDSDVASVHVIRGGRMTDSVDVQALTGVGFRVPKVAYLGRSAHAKFLQPFPNEVTLITCTDKEVKETAYSQYNLHRSSNVVQDHLRAAHTQPNLLTSSCLS